MSAQRFELLIHALVTAVNLAYVADDGFSLSREGGQEQEAGELDFLETGGADRGAVAAVEKL